MPTPEHIDPKVQEVVDMINSMQSMFRLPPVENTALVQALLGNGTVSREMIQTVTDQFVFTYFVARHASEMFMRETPDNHIPFYSFNVFARRYIDSMQPAPVEANFLMRILETYPTCDLLYYVVFHSALIRKYARGENTPIIYATRRNGRQTHEYKSAKLSNSVQISDELINPAFNKIIDEIINVRESTFGATRAETERTGLPTYGTEEIRSVVDQVTIQEIARLDEQAQTEPVATTSDTAGIISEQQEITNQRLLHYYETEMALAEVLEIASGILHSDYEPLNTSASEDAVAHLQKYADLLAGNHVELPEFNILHNIDLVSNEALESFLQGLNALVLILRNAKNELLPAGTWVNYPSDILRVPNNLDELKKWKESLGRELTLAKGNVVDQLRREGVDITARQADKARSFAASLT